MTLRQALRNAAIVAVFTAIATTIIAYVVSRQLVLAGIPAASIALVIYLSMVLLVRALRAARLDKQGGHR